MRKFYILVGLLTIFSILCHSQVIDFQNDNYWIDAGYGGYYTTENTDGFSWGLSANLTNNNTLYKIRFINHQEFQLLGPDPLENFNEAGLMLGKGITKKYFSLQVSAGLGVTGGIKRGKLLYTETNQGWFTVGDPRHFEKDKFITPAIPLEIDFQLKPIKYASIGLSLYGNLNLEKPLYGFLIKFGIGKLR